MNAIQSSIGVAARTLFQDREDKFLSASKRNWWTARLDALCATTSVPEVPQTDWDMPVEMLPTMYRWGWADGDDGYPYPPNPTLEPVQPRRRPHLNVGRRYVPRSPMLAALLALSLSQTIPNRK